MRRPIRDRLMGMRRNPLPQMPALQPGALQPLTPDFSAVMAAGGAQAGAGPAPAPAPAPAAAPSPAPSSVAYYGYSSGAQVATAAGFGACGYEPATQTVLCAGARYPATFIRSGTSMYGRSMALVQSPAFGGGTQWVEFAA